MEEILESIGLSEHLAAFVENKIGLEESLHLTDEEFRLLGVNLIGDRVRIRNRCRETLNGCRSSVLTTFMERRKRRRTGNAKCGATRKVELGWKHHTKGRFQLMSERRGGGKHHFDAPKDMTHDGMLHYAQNLFFPGGKSFDEIKIDEVRCSLCYFNAQRVSENWRTDEPFSSYVQRLSTNPIRFYLHTQPIECSDAAISRRTRSRSTRSRTVASTQTSSEIQSGVAVEECPDIIAQEEPDDITPAHANCSPGAVEERTTFISQEEPDDLTPVHPNNSPRTEEECTAIESIAEEEPDYLSTANNIPGTFEECTNIIEEQEEPDDLTPALANSSPHMGNDMPSYSGTPTIVFNRPQPDMENMLDMESDDDDKLPDPQLTVPQLTSTKDSLTLSEIIEVWRSEVVMEGTQPVLIQRKRVLQTARRAVHRSAFDFRRRVYVEFSNEDVGLEDGADDGGPRREFFSDLMKDLKANILEGSSFRHDVGALEAGRYREAGKMVAWSLLNGGPGFPFFSGSAYAFLVGREVADIRLDDVPDMHVRDMLHKILTCDTTEALRIVCQNEETTAWMIDSGVMTPICQLEVDDKEDLVRQLFKSHMFYRVHAEIQQFRLGLQDMEFLQYVTGSPESTESMFVDNVGPLTYRQLKSMYSVHLSPSGSNNRSKEDDTMFAFEDFLRGCESGDSTVTVPDVLRFWTGSERVPPLGFDNKLSITFVPERSPAPLPVAHTCGLVLELMRGFEADAFGEKMTYAINHSGGFFIT